MPKKKEDPNEDLIAVAEHVLAKALGRMKSTPLEGFELKRMKLIEDAVSKIEAWRIL